jgi:Domain of unknown function (DUF6468)
MISIWGWIVDAILAVLLSGTLVMTIRLDRALRVVRRDRAVFEALISNLGSATNSVKLGIQALRNEADRAAEQIERRSEDADKLATDLSFLIEAADRAGARLEEGRQLPPVQAQPRVSDTPPAPATAAPLSDHSGDHSGDHLGGLRQLAGIAKRRRTQAPGTSAFSQQTESGTPELDEPLVRLRSQRAR